MKERYSMKQKIRLKSVDESVILVWKESKNGFTRSLCSAGPGNARERNLNFLHLLIIC